MKNIRPFIFVVLVIMFFALAHLYVYTKNISLHYEVKQLKIKLGKLHDETRYLTSLASEKRSLDRIEEIAKTKLNMVWPNRVTYLDSAKEKD